MNIVMKAVQFGISWLLLIKTIRWPHFQLSNSSTIILSLSQMSARQYTSSLSLVQTCSRVSILYTMKLPAMFGVPSGREASRAFVPGRGRIGPL